MEKEIRKLFPITERYAYLNHAAVSAPPLPVVEAVHSQLRDVQQNGVLNYKNWIATKDRARRGIAEMLNARPEQVVFMRNTSDGLSTIANGISWQHGDNIVTFRQEFPSNIYPWLNIRDQYGVEIRMCEERGGRIDLSELIELIDSRTRVVALSSVQYGSGFQLDLERVGRAAREHDALFVVDAIQSLGVIPIDVEAQFVDVAAGACHKWLLTPEGIGFLYISDRARARIHPTLVGWVSVQNPEDYNNFDQEWKEGALPWETGTGPTSLFYGLEAGLKILQGVGVERIKAYLFELTDSLCEELTARGYEVVSSRQLWEKSQIVCIKPKPEWTPMSVYVHLKRQNVVVAPRGERIRISPHFYNDQSDIDSLLSALP
jgi:cysteine desulfurase / selenocysteine lyase